MPGSRHDYVHRVVNNNLRVIVDAPGADCLLELPCRRKGPPATFTRDDFTGHVIGKVSLLSTNNVLVRK